MQAKRELNANKKKTHKQKSGKCFFSFYHNRLFDQFRIKRPAVWPYAGLINFRVKKAKKIDEGFLHTS